MHEGHQHCGPNTLALSEREDKLKAEIRQKEMGLSLWKRREKKYEEEIEKLRHRIDEMSDVVRSKERQVFSLKNKDAKHKEEIRMLKLFEVFSPLPPLLRLSSVRRPYTSYTVIEFWARLVRSTASPTYLLLSFRYSYS